LPADEIAKLSREEYVKLFGDYKRCTKCGDRYANEENILRSSDYCTDCSIHLKYKDITLSLADICELPAGSFKRMKIEENLMGFFQMYKENIKSLIYLINSDGKFSTLENICRDKSPNDIRRILCGRNDDFIPYPIMITAKYADKLFSNIEKELEKFNTNSNSDDMYKKKVQYIHTISPYVFDVWNMKYSDGTFRCYWQEFGEMRCPNNIDELFCLWGRGNC